MGVDPLGHECIEGHGHEGAQPCDLAGRHQLGTRNARRARPAQKPAGLGRKMREHGIAARDTSREIGSVTNVRQQFKDKGRHEQVHVCRTEPATDKRERPLRNGKGKRVLSVLERAYARDLGDRACGAGRLVIGRNAERRLHKLGLGNHVE